MTRYIIVTQVHGIVDSHEADSPVAAAKHMNLGRDERMYAEVDYDSLWERMPASRTCFHEDKGMGRE